MALKHGITFERQTRCIMVIPYVDGDIMKPRYHKPEHFWGTQEAWQGGNPNLYWTEYLEADSAILDALIQAKIPGADAFETCNYGEYTLTFNTDIDTTEAIKAQGAVYNCVEKAYAAFLELLDRQQAIRKLEDEADERGEDPPELEDAVELYHEYAHIFG